MNCTGAEIFDKKNQVESKHWRISEEKEKGFHTGGGNNVFGGKEVVSEEGRRRKRKW